MTTLEDSRHPSDPWPAGADQPGLAWRRGPAKWGQPHPVLLACVATAAVHLMFLTRELGPDEGGFAVVGQVWQRPGAYLYGPEWVDRPPLLIAVFALADRLGPYGVRVLAAAATMLLVGAAGWAAGAVRGRCGAGWAAWTAFAFGSSTLFQAQRLNGELLAAAMVMVSVGALLRGYRGNAALRRRLLLGVLSGAAAAAAVLVKQSFADALVFAFVLLLATLARSRGRPFGAARVGQLALGFALGVALVSWPVVGWAGHRHRLGALTYAMYGFRLDAARVMAGWSFRAPGHRMVELVAAATLSGLLPLLAVLLVSQRRRLTRPDPLTLAIGAAMTVALAGIMAGGNFWPHYVLALVPMTALATGLAAADDRDSAAGEGWLTGPGWDPVRTATSLLPRGIVVAAVLLTAVRAPIAAYEGAHSTSAAFTTGRWVAESAAAGDTIVVAYSHPNVIHASMLAPAYPYAWSLPTRTLDPQLRLLVRRLQSASAPTWFVQWDAPHAWGLDTDDQVETALQAHYTQVGTVCGHAVWVHLGLRRDLAALPARTDCGTPDR